jgi:murein DD-endopeptidase MepM/ murein hydrolase activator NlpD
MKQKIFQIKKALKPKIDLLIVQIFTSVLKPFSRHSRQIFEFKRIKQAVGSLMVVSVLAMAVLPASLSTVQANFEANQAQVEIDLAALTTEQSVRLPMETFKFSQGFSFFHPGIDLATAKGTPVYPIMEGYIEQVEESRWGYGNHVYINHGNGFRSLYAHLAQIEVKKDEFVNRDSIVGLVGSSGWSSGPHLHLQIWEGEKLINPRTFLEGYFGKKLASFK